MSELSKPQSIRQPTLVRPSPQPEWLTYAQAGAMAALSRGTLWKLVSAGEVEAARVGRAVRINRQSLTDYMKRSATGSTDNAHGSLSPIGEGNGRQRQSSFEEGLPEWADKTTFDSTDRGL